MKKVYDWMLPIMVGPLEAVLQDDGWWNLPVTYHPRLNFWITSGFETLDWVQKLMDDGLADIYNQHGYIESDMK